MSLTRHQIEAWNPATLTAIGEAWNTMGTKIEGLFDRYQAAVSTLNGTDWQGVAADAALARAESDRRAAIRVVDHLQRAAQIAIEGFYTVDPPLQRARNAISGAEQAGFTVNDDLSLMWTPLLLVDADSQAAYTRWQNAINQAAADTERADGDVRTALAGARADLRVAFTAPAALGGDQGRGDAAALNGDPSKLTPEQLQRLVEAGSLTPQELAALQSGDTTTIPASQMEYVNALARSLDDMSPQDVEKTLNALPPDARQGVANALQLLSTNKVTASVRGDQEIPTNGAADLLPRQMYASLTRPDLVKRGWQMTSAGAYEEVALNGVADNQAIARIAGMSDPALKHDTGLDRSVMATARSYLSAQVAWEQDPDHEFVAFTVDGRGEHANAPLTEGMFHAVSEDRALVASTLNGSDGRAFLSDVFNHEWSDDGKSVSELFHVSADDAVGNPGDRVDQVRATESGDIAEQVARYMSDNNDKLLHLAGDPGTSVGERNPDLMVAIADDLAPYYSTFAGAESVGGVGHFDTMQQLADMYSVLATNPDAGVHAAQVTYAQENALAAAYGSGHAPSTYAQIAGQMQHALEVGTADAAKALDQGDVYAANWKLAVEGAQWDTAKSAAGIILGEIPGGGILKNLVDVASPSLKTSMLGIVDPSAVTSPDNGVPHGAAASMVDSNVTVQNIVNGLTAADPSLVNDPALADLRGTDANGDPYLKVSNLRDQDTVSKVLYETYGLDVDSWYTQFGTGMDTGTIAVAGRK